MLALRLSQGTMIQLSINLPAKRRLDLHLVKRRNSFDDTPLLPSLGKIRRVRKGNKLSRFFRHIFEHKNIKRFLGANLALTIISTSFLSQNSINTSNTSGPKNVLITEAPIVLTTKITIRYPVEKVIVSQGYRFYHPAIDFDGITGDNIFPIMDGKVKAVNYSKIGYGNAVYIMHGDNFSSLYAHLSKIEVKKDQEVTTKTKIGEMGSTGRTSGDHLHFELYKNNYPINPFSVLP